MGAPKTSSKRSRTSTGSGDPPETPARRCGSSTVPPSAAASSATYMLGTPAKTVTSSRARISSALAGSKRGSSVTVAPAWTTPLSATVWPKTWKNGRAPNMTSPGARSKRPADSAALARRLWCVRTAPLGRPVVPEV